VLLTALQSSSPSPSSFCRFCSVFAIQKCLIVFSSLCPAQEHCKAVGDYLLTEMRALQKKHNGGASLPLHFSLIISKLLHFCCLRDPMAILLPKAQRTWFRLSVIHLKPCIRLGLSDPENSVAEPRAGDTLSSIFVLTALPWERFSSLRRQLTRAHWCIASFSSVIGDVRGRGLMLGMELVTDRTTKAPATAETLQVFEKMKGEPLIRLRERLLLPEKVEESAKLDV
jgi:hypothetical protein